MASIFKQKRKVFKCVLLGFVSIALLYFSFMVGRHSWLIEKPAFLLSPKELFWISKAKELMLEDGLTEESLKSPRVQDAVIVHFNNASGFMSVEITLDKTSGEPLSWNKYE